MSLHARYVRVWALAALAALVAAVPLAFAGFEENAVVLAAGGAFLGLALALGLLPAFARRDWPTPLHAFAAVSLAALALPLVLAQPRAFHALVGASLLLGALQPLALLLSPRWPAPPQPEPTRPTDRAALGALGLSLALVAAGGLLLVALPRGLPHAALALLAAAPLAAALGALLFVLPREANAPLPAATLAWGALAALALGVGALAWAFAAPFGADFRAPVALVALAFALATLALLRAPTRPRLLGSALALAVLAALALLLATLFGAPNALAPVALYAALALGLVLASAALLAAAPLLLPGRPRGERWTRWAPALLIAALFLYTPAIQYGRSGAPALLVASAGVLVLAWGLAPLARAR